MGCCFSRGAKLKKSYPPAPPWRDDCLQPYSRTCSKNPLECSHQRTQRQHLLDQLIHHPSMKKRTWLRLYYRHPDFLTYTLSPWLLRVIPDDQWRRNQPSQCQLRLECRDPVRRTDSLAISVVRSHHLIMQGRFVQCPWSACRLELYTHHLSPDSGILCWGTLITKFSRCHLVVFRHSD